MKIFVTDSEGVLHPVEGETVVIQLKNGKMIELVESNYPPEATTTVTLYGGRQPQPSWEKDETLRHTEQLHLSLLAGNCMNIKPGRDHLITPEATEE